MLADEEVVEVEGLGELAESAARARSTGEGWTVAPTGTEMEDAGDELDVDFEARLVGKDSVVLRVGEGSNAK